MEFGTNLGNSYLSSARIRDRGFAFAKIDGGGEFFLTRHLNAWEERRPMQRVVQRWTFNLGKLQYKLKETQNWKTSDPTNTQ